MRPSAQTREALKSHIAAYDGTHFADVVSGTEAGMTPEQIGFRLGWKSSQIRRYQRGVYVILDGKTDLPSHISPPRHRKSVHNGIRRNLRCHGLFLASLATTGHPATEAALFCAPPPMHIRNLAPARIRRFAPTETGQMPDSEYKSIQATYKTGEKVLKAEIVSLSNDIYEDGAGLYRRVSDDAEASDFDIYQVVFPAVADSLTITMLDRLEEVVNCRDR